MLDLQWSKARVLNAVDFDWLALGRQGLEQSLEQSFRDQPGKDCGVGLVSGLMVGTASSRTHA